MKAIVYSLRGEKKGEVSLGKAFSARVRTDIIRRAFLAEASRKRQPYGADPLAGKRTSAHYHGKRHYRYTMMNREMARMKRIHSQGFLNMTARFVPQATKGRKAHPPKAEKQWKLKINKKEKLLALRSALSATVQPEFASRYAGEKQQPIIIEDSFQDLKKTKDVLEALKTLGLNDELRVKRKVRAGRGKSRGRKFRKRRGPLIIVSKEALPSPPGAEVINVKDITVSDIAPGGDAGRLCIWTQSSIEEAGSI